MAKSFSRLEAELGTVTRRRRHRDGRADQRLPLGESRHGLGRRGAGQGGVEQSERAGEHGAAGGGEAEAEQPAAAELSHEPPSAADQRMSRRNELGLVLLVICTLTVLPAVTVIVPVAEQVESPVVPLASVHVRLVGAPLR